MNPMKVERIRVLVADDHALFRRGVAELLREEGGFELVGEASNGRQAVEMCRSAEPDVILMDVHMPGGSGTEAVRQVKDTSNTRVLMLTVSDKDDDLLGAIEAGADGYLLKNAEPQDLFRGIRKVASGQGYLSPEVTNKVMRRAVDAEVQLLPVPLSPREREVLARLAKGFTTAEIAADLVISASTVKTHVRHILEKLEAANRTEAVARAAAMGLLDSCAGSG